jgi:hypothetical protein
LRRPAVRRAASRGDRRRPRRLARGARRGDRDDARASDIVAALGPTIARQSYEVGPEFVASFAEAESDAGRFFAPSVNAGRSLFDLPAFIAMRVARSGVEQFEDLALDTYADETRFFSYRRSVHRGEADYGRLVAAVALV